MLLIVDPLCRRFNGLNEGKPLFIGFQYFPSKKFKVIIFRSGDTNGIIGRANAHHVDLNRNFPDQFFTTRQNKKQEPETLAIMQWLQDYPFVLSANLHGGSLVANYPYDDTKSGHSVYSKSPDDATFKMISEAFSLVRDLFQLIIVSNAILVSCSCISQHGGIK